MPKTLATAHGTQRHAGAQGVTVLESWQQIVFLERDRNCKGEPVYVVRLRFGTLAPFRFGPYATEAEARQVCQGVIEELDGELYELVTNLQITVVGAHEMNRDY